MQFPNQYWDYGTMGQALLSYSKPIHTQEKPK